eukprot:6489404-Amphidinium_carterae.1
MHCLQKVIWLLAHGRFSDAMRQAKRVEACHATCSTLGVTPAELRRRCEEVMATTFQDKTRKELIQLSTEGHADDDEHMDEDLAHDEHARHRSRRRDHLLSLFQAWRKRQVRTTLSCLQDGERVVTDTREMRELLHHHWRAIF